MTISWKRSVLIGISTTLAVIAAASSVPVQQTVSVMDYLSKFGYLPSSTDGNSHNLIDSSTLTDAIKAFQSFVGLTVTGYGDEETLQVMAKPRCGFPDKKRYGSDNRAQSFKQGSPAWQGKDLTYRIKKYSKHLDKATVDREIVRAFAVWSEHTDLTFTAKAWGTVHIEISFVEGQHGACPAFDGTNKPENVLAHAFYPVDGGATHFDDAEQWTINTSRGQNLFQTAAHEFGHALGLDHSSVNAALMFPFSPPYNPNFKLDSDDVRGIQTLYGRKTIRDGSKFPQNICSDPKIDTMLISSDGGLFALKGNYVYLVKNNTISEGYPKLISEAWPGLPGDINAAFTYFDGKTYFFKGTKYWRYNGFQMEKGYPLEISGTFTGIPDDLDTALIWDLKGSIAFFKDSDYWVYNPSTPPQPKNWPVLPSKLDALLTYNGITYFFKGDKYCGIWDTPYSTNQHSIGEDWFGCKNIPKTTSGNIPNVQPTAGTYYPVQTIPVSSGGSVQPTTGTYYTVQIIPGSSGGSDDAR